MSEYQHYQFLALDQPLSEDRIAEVRELTTRATLTPTSFLNTYEWGDFSGDVDELMDEYYDAHLYFANWGDRVVMLRWPVDQLPFGIAARYCAGESAIARQHGDHVIVTLVSTDEEDEFDDFEELFDPVDEERDESWLPSIAEARADVAGGDLRLLYLAWLLCLTNGDLDDDEPEPPVPTGLDDLPDSLVDLATFLRLDFDLIASAAS